MSLSFLLRPSPMLACNSFPMLSFVIVVPCIEKLIPTPVLWDKAGRCWWVLHQGASHLQESSDMRIQGFATATSPGRSRQMTTRIEDRYHVEDDAKDCKHKERARRPLHSPLSEINTECVLFLYTETSQIGRVFLMKFKKYLY